MARVWRDTYQCDSMLLYSGNTSLGWRIMRTIHRREGERAVERGSMRRVHDEITGKHLGYQVIGSAEQRGDKDRVSLSSTASISAREMEANAGAYGRSRTASMPEWKRECRRHPDTGALLPMEDFVERTRAKVAVFPLVGPRKGDIVRAWDAAEKAGLL